MTPAKIIYVLGTFAIGGTETQLLELLRRINREQFVPIVYAFGLDGPLRARLESLAIPLFIRDYAPPSESRIAWLRGALALVREMTRFFRQQRPMIVQSFLPSANLFAAISAKSAAVPVIITGRRATLNANDPAFPAFPHQWLLHASNLWVTAIVANSMQLRDECLMKERWLSPRKIRVIHNGVDVERFHAVPSSFALERAYGIPEHALVVGTIANLESRKGHSVLLRAAGTVLQQMPDTRFVLIGRDDGMRETLETFADHAGIRQAIVFAGQQRNIPEWLSIMDILVSSSHLEGLSNVLLEGMAAGLPIVATRVAGTPEVVVDGDTGLLVPPGEPDVLADAILRLLRDRKTRENMGSAGRQRVHTAFRIERMVAQTETLYRELLDQKSMRRVVG